MLRRRVAVLVLLAAAVLASGPAGLRAQGLRVGSVDVQGAKRAGADAVRAVMGTKPGGEFDLARIREDVKAIYRLGYFQDVRVDTEEAPGGYRVLVVVTEKPLIGGIRIEGNKEIDTPDLKKEMTLKERTLFQPEKVKESARKIVEAYQKKGFIDAKAEGQASEEPDGTIRIVFHVVEGEKLKIEKIRIAGNHFLDEKAIRKVMETTEKGFFSFISDSGTFKKDVLDGDVGRIEALYQNDGFADSKVFDPEVQRGAKGLELRIRIYEGRQYRVGSIRFAGTSDIPEAVMREKVKTAAGEIFNREVLVADLLTLTTLQNDNGYAQALVSPLVEKRKAYPLVDITFKTDRGGKFRFGRVEVTGNTKTLDRIVRRNLDVADGKTFTATGLKDSRENLTRLSYFKDIKITTAPSKQKADEMDVKVEVQEGPTGTFSGGAGYSSLDKIFGVVQLQEQNFLGRGWKTGISSQFGARRTVFTIDFRDPHFLDSDYSLFLEGYKTRTIYPDFEKKAVGGKIGSGYALSRFVSHSMTFRMDEATIYERSGVLSPSIRQEAAKGRQSTHSAIYAINRNTTDKWLDPSRGTTQQISVEYAGGPLGGDGQFLKYFLEGKSYTSLLGSGVFSSHLLWGHALPTRGGEIPLAERFFLGGPYSVRGYRSRTLSPVDPATLEIVGGNKELIGNLELLVPLFNEIGIKGVVFLDGGNAWAQGAWPWHGETLRYGTGFGIRWYSPMGPLRFEWGWALNPKAGEPRRVVEFTIGTTF